MPKQELLSKRKLEEEVDVAQKALKTHGEAFMRMFEDSDAHQPEDAATSDSESDREDGAKQPPETFSTPALREGAITVQELDFGNIARRKQGGTGSPLQLLTKKQRRLFMSGKAADVHTDAAEQLHTLRTKGKADGALTPNEFKELRREVDNFGANGLDKRQRKMFDATTLSRLNASLEKRPRIPASIGKGAVAKRAQRQQRELQEAIDAGMVQQKGLGKKKQRAKEKSRRTDRGLMEDNGAFRSGKLLVKGIKGDEVVKKRRRTTRL